MEDIFEKLRLINYEISFCDKFKKDTVCKYYFACNLNFGSKPTTPIINNQNIYNINQNPSTSPQFIYFYEICNWLTFLIKQV